MGEKRYSPMDLAERAGVDEKTIRTFIAGQTWPWTSKRAGIEEALGWQVGTLQAMVDGVYAGDPDIDPVQRAIEASELTRANKAKLLGMYYELLDGQGEGVRGA